MALDLGQVAAQLGFGKWYDVRGRVSVADIFRPHERCGIYLLSFANGEAYAGQAVDVTRRYAQHRKVHPDIEVMTFQTVIVDDLDNVERSTIRKLEGAGIRLRNVVFASIPYGPSDFDLIMRPEEQERWLTDVSYVDLAGPRTEDADTRRRFSRKYQELLRRPKAEDVVRVLRDYVGLGIPAVPRGEMSFWAASCLPGSHSSQVTVYSRVNVYQQEVFTAYWEADDLTFTWHLAKSPLQRAFGPFLWRLRLRFPRLRIDQHAYEPGGQDQLTLEIRGADAALKLTHNPDVLTAIRLFNLRLIKKGPCMFSRYHCFDLADRFYEGDRE